MSKHEKQRATGFPARQGTVSRADDNTPSNGAGPGEIMGLNAPGTPVPIEELSELLQSARLPVLRSSSAADLRNLVASLEVACEAARVTALCTVLGARRQVADVDDAGQNCGFAALFAALRRARAEVKRRDIAPSKRTAAAFRTSRKPAFSQRASRGRALVAERTAPG